MSPRARSPRAQPRHTRPRHTRPPRARPWLAWFVSAALAGALVGCGSEPAAQGARQPTPAGTQTAASPGAQPPAPEPAADVPEELNFTATTLNGEQFRGQSLAGRPAVLWFWAPWCPNCRAEAPTLARTESAHGEEVTFVGVASQDDLGAMRDFVAKYGVDGFEHLNDSSGQLWQRFGITYQPAYAFISPDGTVDVVRQQLSESDLTDRVEELAG